MAQKQVTMIPDPNLIHLLKGFYKNKAIAKEIYQTLFDKVEAFSLQNKYIIKQNKTENSITTVVFSEVYSEDECCSTKLDVDGIACKYRIYYRTVWNNNDSPNLLTYILLNPSTANQYTNDPTINNCIKLANENNYDGIEIINIYTERNPVFSKINRGSCFPQVEIVEYADNVKPILKNIVLAYGNKNFNKTDKQNIFKLLSICEKTAEHYFIIGINNLKLIKPGYKINFKQIRHPGNQGWSALGGFKNAKLEEIDEDFDLEKLTNYPRS